MTVSVPVEQLVPGDVLDLRRAGHASVEAVEEFADGLLIVRWRRPATRGEPGHDRTRGGDGWYLGSLAPMPPGTPVRLERRKELS